MITVREVYEAIDAFAPFDTAEGFDNVGVLVDCGSAAGKILFSLDVTEDTVEEAREFGCGILVAHHPVMLGGVTKLGFHDPVTAAVRANVSVVVAHTNFDKAPGGINDALAERLELDRIGSFCDGLGRIGILKHPMQPEAFAAYVKRRLGTGAAAVIPGEREIKTVAVGGGSYDFVEPAVKAGADALVTGELKHHHGLQARRNGITAVAAGHFETENPGMEAMCGYLQKVFAKSAECLFSKMGKSPFQWI